MEWIRWLWRWLTWQPTGWACLGLSCWEGHIEWAYFAEEGETMRAVLRKARCKFPHRQLRITNPGCGMFRVHVALNGQFDEAWEGVA